MAGEIMMKRGIRYLSELLTAYARAKGWSDYRLLFDPSLDWERIRILIVGPFSRSDAERQREWEDIIDYLTKEIKQPFFSLHLVLRTPEEVEEGGLYSINPDYVEAQEI